jgi:hypothetical protein
MRSAARWVIACLALSSHALAAEPSAPATPSDVAAPNAPAAPTAAAATAAAPSPAPSDTASNPEPNNAVAATAEPAPPPAPATKPPLPPPGDLQAPANVSTRYSAYSLPARTWAFDIGALGIGGGDVFANLGAGYGFGGGFQVEMNLAHMGVGLVNGTVGWHFIDSRYFDLGARAGIWYVRGQWFWIAQGPAKNLVRHIEALKVPLDLIASSQPVRWLELDLGIHYSYTSTFGTADNADSVFSKADLVMNQFSLRPGARVFITDRTALETSVELPLYSGIPLKHETVTVPFKSTWSLEVGVRSRLTRALFGNIRLHYGSIPDVLYGARLYPSFDIEVRF